MTGKKPTLLAPAGTPEALDAAIHAGADAVYFGADAFNARMFAGNFTKDTLRDALKKCAFYGVQSNITVNTMPRPGETAAMLSLCEELYCAGADALIVADLGIAAALHRALPDLPLHASTQCGGHSVAWARALRDIGFCRMVAAREMSGEDLRFLCENSPIETEIFIHGALCVSTSGGCLFSSAVGGRSGNRGACAQPCRMACRVDGCREDYALSLRDNCLAGHIKELCDMGAAALKIEGRMKSPEYVYGTVEIYRRLLDEERNAEPQELRALAALFSRGGYTDNYYTGRTCLPMGGIRSEGDKEATARAEKEVRQRRQEKKLPLTLACTVAENTPLTLSLRCGQEQVTVTGQCPERAITSPLSEQSLRERLSKLGATPFRAQECTLSLQPGLTAPPAALNDLRRRGCEELLTLLQKDPRRVLPQSPRSPEAEPCSGDTFLRCTALFQTLSQIPENSGTVCDGIFLPLAEYIKNPSLAAQRGVNGVALPPVLFEKEQAAAEIALCRAKKSGARYCLINGLGQLALAADAGLIPYGGLRCNIWNGGTLALYREGGAAGAVLSAELTERDCRDIPAYLPKSVLLYGRLPLMTLERCIMRRGGEGCRECETKPGVRYLTDRRGVRFPVFRLLPHRNIIYNSVPTWMLDRQEQLRQGGIDGFFLLFTTESRERAGVILENVRRGSAPDEPFRRMGMRENNPDKTKKHEKKHP